MSYGTAAANSPKTDLQTPVDTGTSARSQHGGGIRIAPRTCTEGGIETNVGAQARYADVLEELLGEDPLDGHLAGDQGSRDDRRAVARSRHEAGTRLRSLFVKAGLVPVKAFNPGKTAGPEEPSDAQVMARAQYNAIIRKMGPWGEIVAGPCCYDLHPDNDRWRSNVRKGLDKLCEVML